MSNKELTLGSLFSGSGGFELGAVLAGIKPIWNSDIAPFAIRVTTKRFPDVKHYGDVSTLSGAELEPVDVITFGSPCFPEGTLVLTENGYLPIEDVEVGMKVLTHMGRWRTVTAAGAKYGETLILRGNHYGLECTSNHPIYTCGEKKYYPQLGNGKRGNQRLLTGDREWIPAEGMLNRLWAVPNKVETLPIVSPRYSGSWRQKVMPDYSVDFFYFVGRWLGDGWVNNSQRKGRPDGQHCGKVVLCDSHDKEEQLRKTVEAVTGRYTVERQRTAVKLTFSSQVLCDWLTDNFGQYALGKTMPGWVFGMPGEYRKAILDGLLDSDGCAVKGKTNAWKITTVSKQLAESIRLLAEIQGYSTTVHKTSVEKQRLIEGRIVNQHDWYSVVITKGEKRRHLKDDLHGWYRVRSVSKTGRTKMVYNLTVEEDNSYVADGIVVHNCQDLSIAGRRAGIQDGERSNLFFQAIRIIKEMREATHGEKPRYAVWENVPGAFTSNGGEDFKAVLEAVIGVVEEKAPPVPSPEQGRWPSADLLVGDGWSVAYRVFDAQYWGVPQRRKRIFLVADFAGGSAPKVLFDSEGLSGYSHEGFRAWQRAANGAAPGSGEASRGIPVINPQGSSGITITEDVTATLIAQDHGHHPAVLDEPLKAAGFLTESSATAHTIGYEEEKSPTLRAGNVPGMLALEKKPFSIGSYSSEAWKSDNPKAGVYEADTARTLDQSGGSPVPRQGGMAIVETYAMTTGYYTQVEEEKTPPLLARDYKDPAIVNDREDESAEYRVRRLTPTECARLQGFPDWWCARLETENPTEKEIDFWEDVFETYRKVTNPNGKPKTRKQIVKWLKAPYTDGAEYSLWGNGLCASISFFIMAGIVWASAM